MAVFCPCREPHALDSSSIPSLIGEEDCFFAAASLLFCTTCHAVRCPYCTIKEPVSWYCSQCLMETTKRGAAESSNRCLRGCLRCPQCKSNAVVKPGDHEKLLVRCSLCSYEHTLQSANGRSLANTVRDAQSEPFVTTLAQIQHALPPYPKHQSKDTRELYIEVPTPSRNTSTPTPQTPEYEGQELPSLAPLRAKYRKLCRVCGSILVDPDRHPAKAKYLAKSVALPYLPALEIHKTDKGLKMLARSFSPSSLDVKLASLHPQVALPATLRVPPAAESGLRAPLFLVSRESVESKQAFMNGAASATQGPGWALGNIDLQEGLSGLKSLTVFASARASGDEKSSPVGAWMKLKIPDGAC